MPHDRPKLSMSAGPVPINVEILEYGRTKTYRIDRTASMEGVNKFKRKVLWSLNEANQEGIPLRVPSFVVLLTHKAHQTGRPFNFKLKFSIEASIGLSLNPQRWSVFAPRLEPVRLENTMQLVPLGKEIDSDFSSLELQRLTKTNFTDEA